MSINVSKLTLCVNSCLVVCQGQPFNKCCVMGKRSHVLIMGCGVSSLVLCPGSDRKSKIPGAMPAVNGLLSSGQGYAGLDKRGEKLEASECKEVNVCIHVY